MVVSLKPGAALNPADLHEFLRQRLPAYMTPKYIDIRATPLPKTPTGKIVKSALRKAGIRDVWAAIDQRTGRR